ncbi:MAG: hypothetical protein ACI8PG_004663 [Planctomycetota bacterium]|jgi:hypothetical protein
MTHIKGTMQSPTLLSGYNARKIFYKGFFALSSLVLLCTSCAQNNSLKPLFSHQLKMADAPKLFLSGVVSQRGKVHFGSSCSDDGNTIIISSNRPHNKGQTAPQNSALWQFQRTDSGWGNAQIIELDMGSTGGFGYPTTTRDNTLYFHYSAENAKPDIYRAEFKNGENRNISTCFTCILIWSC